VRKIFDGLKISYQRKDVVLVFLLATLFFAFLIVLIQKVSPILSLIALENFSFIQKSLLVFYFFTDLKSSFTSNSLLLGIISSVLSGINVSLAYTYFKIKAASLLKNSLHSGAGLILVFLGVGCAACNTVILSVIFGAFGMSSIIFALPYNGLEIGIAGILILTVSIAVLARKIAEPNVC
jgi:hypothetical protein